jgi:hypothetical protein
MIPKQNGRGLRAIHGLRLIIVRVEDHNEFALCLTSQKKAQVSDVAEVRRVVSAAGFEPATHALKGSCQTVTY